MAKCSTICQIWITAVIVLSLGSLLDSDHQNMVPEASAGSTVSVVKSVSPTSISEDEPAFVSITIKNQSPKDIKNVALSEILPPIFVSQSSGLFSDDNILSTKIDLIRKGNSYFTSYTFKLEEGVNVPDGMKIRLTPSFVSFQNTGETRSQSIQSSPVELTITNPPTEPLPDNYSWVLTVAALLATSFAFGAFGGLLNFRIGRSQKGGEVYTSSVNLSDRMENRYHLRIDYDTSFNTADGCKIAYTCYRIDQASPAGTDVFSVYISTADRTTTISESVIPAGADQNDEKTGTINLFVPMKGIYHLSIRERGTPNAILGIPIYATERIVGVNVLAGGAAGLITLLGIFGATALFTDTGLKANAETMTTLAVSTFIAGFIPFQIIEKASGQLKDKINFLSQDLVREKSNTDEEASEKDRISKRLALSKTTERNQMSTMNKLSQRLRQGYQAPAQAFAAGQRFDPIHAMLATDQMIPTITISQTVREAMKRMEDGGIDRIIVNDEPGPAPPVRSYVLLSARIELEDLNKPIFEILTKLDPI